MILSFLRLASGKFIVNKEYLFENKNFVRNNVWNVFKTLILIIFPITLLTE